MIPTNPTTPHSKYQSSSQTWQIFSSLFLFSFFPSFVITVDSTSFTLKNQCSYTVWPGILSGAGTSQLPSTGFALQPGESGTVPVPTAWSGRLWGRTLCSPTGEFYCVTGDCGSGTIECNGSGAAPPASLAEFTLNGADGLDFYDVSLVDGYNLPMLIEAVGGTGGNCSSTGCPVDLNDSCPNELKVVGANGGGVACRSACEAFGDDAYCCSGAYASPQTCPPTAYSEFFKSACPRAYSYAFDDGTSTFTCASAVEYVITFCPADPSNNGRTTGGGGGGGGNVTNNVPYASSASSGRTIPLIVYLSLAAAVWLLLQ